MIRDSSLNILAATGLAFAALCATADISAAGTCKPPRPRPTIVLKNMGPCDFNPDTLSFAGEPARQAMCLMRAMDHSRNLNPLLASLPDALATRIGQSVGLPSREQLSAYLSQRNLEWDLAANLWRPVSHARDNDPQAPAARYFVLHDTSGPYYGGRPFPADIDTRASINNLSHFKCSDNWEKAHAVINRKGDILLGHDFEIPWRETKFERAKNFDGALKGLFLHVEMIQPRRRAPGRGRRNDAQAPAPGFTAAQYDSLALLYAIASVRAGNWLIPAFHAALDTGIRGGHDDPMSFEIEVFSDRFEQLLTRLQKRNEPQISLAP